MQEYRKSSFSMFVVNRSLIDRKLSVPVWIFELQIILL